MIVKRRKTRSVNVGDVKIGYGYPVSIQSMTNTDTADASSTVRQIRGLEEAGCEVVRVAVKTEAAALSIREIKQDINIPLVADIHFDHRLALSAVDAGADKIRINPGNMKDDAAVISVFKAASAKKIPVRVGVNSGSLSEMASGKGSAPGLMVEAVERYLDLAERARFRDVVVSLKASDVSATVEAYRIMAGASDVPLHVGVTAAGPMMDGVVKSSMGIGALLLDGIGDTIRVSLTADPVEEVFAAKKILSAAGVRKFGPEIISCPTCGRCQVDLVPIVQELESELKRDPGCVSRNNGKQLLIAVMGCEVNGPGEAGAADVGIAFGKGRGAVFRKGKIVKNVPESSAVKELLDMIKDM